jgi:hypothetical protein
MKITLNKILLVIWLIYLFVQRNDHDPQSSANSTFFLITVLFIAIAIINWWISGTIEHRQRLAASGGPDPFKVYEKYVHEYYYMSGYIGQWVLPSIQVPTPFDSYYHSYKEIWTKPGFWQDEWRAFCLNKPSVYTGDKPLPHPYRGASEGSIQPSVNYKARPQDIEMWRNFLSNNTLAL